MTNLLYDRAWQSDNPLTLLVCTAVSLSYIGSLGSLPNPQSEQELPNVACRHLPTALEVNLVSEKLFRGLLSRPEDDDNKNLLTNLKCLLRGKDCVVIFFNP